MNAEDKAMRDLHSRSSVLPSLVGDVVAFALGVVGVFALAFAVALGAKKGWNR